MNYNYWDLKEWFTNIDFTIVGLNSILELKNRQKKAIVKQVSNNVFCGVRLGGMGIAIRSLIGKELVCVLN